MAAAPVPGLSPPVVSRAFAWRALAGATTAQVALSVADQGIPTLTAFIKTDLGLSASVAALIALSITGGKIIASYAAGRAADAFGERRMLLMGCLGAAITLALAAWLPLPALVAGLVLSGVFIATSPSAGGRLVSSSFPHGRRNLAIGVRQTGIPLGALVGAALLPWVAVNWGWQAAIATSGGVAGLGALAVLLLTEAGAETVGRRRTPTSLRTLLAHRELMIVFAWGCLVVSAQYALLAYLALTVHAAAGTSLALATVVVIAAQAGGVLGRLGWGLVNDTAATKRRRLLLVGISVSGTVAALLLALLPGRVSFSWMIVLGVVAGIALVGWQGMWTTVVMDIVGPADSGAAIGLGVTFIAVTALCLAPVYGLVADLTGSYAATWLAVTGVLAVATLVAAALPETEPIMRTA